MDVNTGKVLTHSADSSNEFFAEPVFVPHPKRNSKEDDGVILSPVSCSDPSRPDYLAILDASSFEEIARAEFDAKFLQCFHGTFVSSSSSNKNGFSCC